MKSELCYPSQDPHYSDSIQMILNYLLITWLIQEACSSIASRKFKETYQKKKKKKDLLWVPERKKHSGTRSSYKNHKVILLSFALKGKHSCAA